MNTVRDVLGIGVLVVQALSQRPSGTPMRVSNCSGKPCRLKTGWPTTNRRTGSFPCAMCSVRSSENQQGERGRDGLPARSGTQPWKWLVAVRPECGTQGSGQEHKGGALRAAICRGVETGGRHLELVGLLAVLEAHLKSGGRRRNRAGYPFQCQSECDSTLRPGPAACRNPGRLEGLRASMPAGSTRQAIPYRTAMPGIARHDFGQRQLRTVDFRFHILTDGGALRVSVGGQASTVSSVLCKVGVHGCGASPPPAPAARRVFVQ